MLTRQGYKLKNDLSKGQSQQIINNLTAKPKMVKGFGPQNQKPIEYPIFGDANTSFYLPRFYGEKSNFGIPKLNRLDPGLPINVPFNGSLRQRSCSYSENLSGLVICSWYRWYYIFKMWWWKNCLSFINYSKFKT